MKKRVQLLPVAIVAVVLLLGVFGCSKQQERYSDPPWLGGSSIETLEKRGNYTIYLRLMELANYTDRITKQLNTLFVPNDEAFNKYFAENGIASVESLVKTDANGNVNNDAATQLFTLHTLQNPRSRYQLIYEYVWSEEQGPHGEYAALFFRKPTYSTSLPYYETGRYGVNKDITRLMYTGNKLVPLFSIDYFEDFFGALDGSDYTFMYPNSKWSDNMNWGNANVIEDPLRVVPANETDLERRNASAIRTSNGFIFLIDEVVAPQKSLEEYMRETPDKFGLYYDIMQRFATYQAGKRFPDRNNEVGYLKNYDLVSNIAEEQGAFTGNEVKMKDMYTAYVPNNQVLQDYLDKKVLNTYPSLDSVPEVTLYYILQTQLGRSLGLISKISASYFNSFGDPLVINKSDIISSHMCSNGCLYEMNKVLEPNVFRCVPGDLFFNSNYSTFLYALNQAGVLASLSNPNQNVTLFAATNDQLYKYGVRYNDITSKIEWRGSDGLWKNMKTDDLIMFCEDHIVNGVESDFKTKGYLEMSSGNFVSFENDMIVGCENQFVKDHAKIAETKVNDNNGILYYLDNPIKSKYVMGKFFTSTPEVKNFKDALVKTKLLNPKFVDSTTKDTIPNLTFLPECTYWTAFAPTNAAWDAAKAAGLIPTDTETLKKFLLYHFVRKNAIFDDGGNTENGMGVSGTYESNRILLVDATLGTSYSPLIITNEVDKLSVTDGSGQVVTVDHSKANILTRKGVAHIINSVLKFK
jgi:uncharacterized surface protein with fasciclin (FAS1) repeats